MKKIWQNTTWLQKVFIVSGSVIFGYGLIMSFLVNTNAGLLLVFGIGIYLLVAGVFYKKLVNVAFARIALTVSLSMLFIGIISASALGIYGCNDTPSYEEEAVIVLGCGIRGEKLGVQLTSRLDAALEYYSSNPNAVIVVSGGQGPGEDITEALAMERYLLEKGVPENKILKEEKSTSTKTNIVYSKSILDEKLTEGYQTVIITNDYHIFRAVYLAERSGINCTHVHSDTRWYEIPIRLSRELLAVTKTFLMD